jgi:RNA methyltransferase, TrmH family
MITSRHNSLVKHARALRDGRETQDQIFIEGLRLAEEATRSGLNIHDALYTEKFRQDERGGRLLEEAKAAGARETLVSEEVLASVSDTKRPQGIVLLAARPHTSPATLFAGAHTGRHMPARAEESLTPAVPLIAVIHGINNPSNAGAILRTAEAAGATGAISTRGTTDLFSPKALRGAMGSSFRLPLWTGADFAEVVRVCREHGVRLTGATLSAARTHTQVDWTLPSALVLGSEAGGLSREELRLLDETIRIPMCPPVESLNVAVACGIILYEAERQRREGESPSARRD